MRRVGFEPTSAFAQRLLRPPPAVGHRRVRHILAHPGTGSLAWGACAAATRSRTPIPVGCARFDILESIEVDDEPRYNIAPTDPVLAVRRFGDVRDLGRLRWGLVPGVWAERKGQRPLINARVETPRPNPRSPSRFVSGAA